MIAKARQRSKNCTVPPQAERSQTTGEEHNSYGPAAVRNCIFATKGRLASTRPCRHCPRLISFCVLQRPFVAYVELLTISFWQSEQVLPRFLEGQSPADEIGSCGAIQLEARNYTVLIYWRPATIQFSFQVRENPRLLR